MTDLRIGVIGVGGRGRLAFEAHRPGHGSVLIAGADPDPSALKNFSDDVIRGGGSEPQLTSDYRKLLENSRVQAVFIMTPDFLHEEIGIAALKAGKAVYMEKPLAITIEGCDRLLQTARETGTKLYVGHNMRHFPVILKMKELIDAGKIGRVCAVWCRHFINYGGDAYFHDWHSERCNTTGLLLQKGAHDIDVIHFLTGERTFRVSGMGMLSVYNLVTDRRDESERGCAAFNDANWPPLSAKKLSPIIDVEDHNMIMMQLSGRVQASYMQCHYTPDSERNYTVIGTEGRLENVGDMGNCQVHLWNQRGRRSEPDEIYNLKEVPGSHGGADPGVVKAFVDFVRFDKPANTSPAAARDAVAVGVMAHESMRGDGGLLDIPELDPGLRDYFDNNQMQ